VEAINLSKESKSAPGPRSDKPLPGCVFGMSDAIRDSIGQEVCRTLALISSMDGSNAEGTAGFVTVLCLCKLPDGSRPLEKLLFELMLSGVGWTFASTNA
jgi:hypothetical protein